MKKLMKKVTYPIILIAILVNIFFTIQLIQDRTVVGKLNFSYKDGLFYQKNTEELYSGRVIDTADVIIEFEVSNGRKNGRFTSYFLEGGIEKDGMIINDKNEGTWKYFYYDGQLETMGDFCNNLPDGEWISFHKNGEISIKGSYRLGAQVGYWSYYDESGKLINSVLFIDDIMIEKVLNTI